MAGERRRRPGPLLTFGLPLGLSLILHAALLAATAAIVWRVASREPEPRLPVHISFDEPGQGSPVLPDLNLVLPIESPREQLPAPAPTPAPRAMPAPRPVFDVSLEQVPAVAPTLSGLASAPTLETAAPVGIRSEGLSGAEIVSSSTPPTPTEVRFAGLGASDATRIVYVVDGSGPMVSTLPIVMEEVLRSISRLSPSQKFGVVIFRKSADGGPGFDWFTPALVRPTPDVLRQLAQWLSRVEPRGSSNPLDGLRAAFGMEPDAIFLLSRSIERSGGGVWQLGLEPTMRELDRLNPADRRTGTRPVAIRTIQFLDEDPSGIMQAIARRHGGQPADGAGAGNPGASGAYKVIRRATDLREADPPPIE